MGLFFEIFLAAMAVFGLWCALCLIAQSVLSSRCIGTVIEVCDRETAARLPALLEEVRHAPFARRGTPIVVLYGEELCMEYGEPGEEERELMAHYGARWAIVNVKAEKQK
jgi:hypothetical protein